MNAPSPVQLYTAHWATASETGKRETLTHAGLLQRDWVGDVLYSTCTAAGEESCTLTCTWPKGGY
eukprot:771380-Prymnesium_polylepis.1